MRNTLILLLLAIPSCCQETCQAQVYPVCVPYRDSGRVIEGHGSAVCILTLRGSNHSFFATVKHNVEDDPGNVWLKDDSGEWIKAEDVRLHPTEDLATFRVSKTVQAQLPLASSSTLVDRTPVVFCGLKTQQPVNGSLVDTEWLKAEGGKHPVPGDSGGPVIIEYGNGKQAVAGLIIGYDTRTKDVNYVHCRRIVDFVKTQYGSCPTCPEYVRPIVRQPMIGIGLPVGPPEILIPRERPKQPAQPVAIGPQGPQGPSGPPGRDGASVDPQQVEAVVVRWLEQNREQLRGERGPAGPAGNAGSLPPDLESRLTELENRKLRIMIVDGANKTVLDDEEYAAGEPVIFDLRRFKGE